MIQTCILFFNNEWSNRHLEKNELIETDLWNILKKSMNKTKKCTATTGMTERSSSYRNF